LKETADEVTSHEELSLFFVVKIIAEPDGITFFVDVIEEPLNRYGPIVV